MNEQRWILLVVMALSLACCGCKDSTKPKVTTPALVANDTPAHAIERLIGAYEQKNESAFAGMFTGDYQYEFSNATDPTLATMFAGGWFRADETTSSSHLFSGYTPPGGSTLYAASSITINLTDTSPTDDNSSGVDPVTHKILATRIDGQIVVPQPSAEVTTYVINNNFNVFYIVRGDSAASLDSNQPGDSLHWYIRRWVDHTTGPAGNRPQVIWPTWGKVKGEYR